jgi:D-sedoheptulose 7-phosphate isomerase
VQAQEVLTRRAERLRRALDEIEAVGRDLAAAARAVADCHRAGGRVFVAGNGGSAAEAQHLTGELLGRLSADRDRGSLAAVALTADAATLTAVANDYGYEEVFARQVSGLARPGDVVVLLSTSGRSTNLVRAAEEAAAAGAVSIGLLGCGPSPLAQVCRHVLAAPADETATIQECHLLLVHALVEAAEDLLAAPSLPGAGAASGMLGA